MRLSHLFRIGTLATLGVLTACSQRTAGAPTTADAATVPAAPKVAERVAADVVAQVPVGEPARDEAFVGRVLDAAKTLGIAFTSNVMGELEPCG
ncbi:MAG: hypothetical protein EP329_16005 [Deltaproteobacteria bacterium]|nr:MAG: hypothetical protein EP329_16005 [Deltaproteobacteria bacterium]